MSLWKFLFFVGDFCVNQVMDIDGKLVDRFSDIAKFIIPFNRVIPRKISAGNRGQPCTYGMHRLCYNIKERTD